VQVPALVKADATYWHCVVLPLASGVVVAVQDAAFAYAAVTTVLQEVGLATV
jgi:hypothetical protein